MQSLLACHYTAQHVHLTFAMAILLSLGTQVDTAFLGRFFPACFLGNFFARSSIIAFLDFGMPSSILLALKTEHTQWN